MCPHFRPVVECLHARQSCRYSFVVDECPTPQRVTYLYDVMDAAYCSHELRDFCRNQSHVPLIDQMCERKPLALAMG